MLDDGARPARRSRVRSGAGPGRRRAIQHQLENPLANRILKGEFAPGDVIKVSARGTAPCSSPNRGRPISGSAQDLCGTAGKERPLYRLTYAHIRIPVPAVRPSPRSIAEALDPQLRQCLECGRKSLKRLVSAVRFRLAGSGWYETDFKSDKEAKRNLHEKADKDEAKADGSGGSEAGTKSEAKDARQAKRCEGRFREDSEGRFREERLFRATGSGKRSRVSRPATTAVRSNRTDGRSPRAARQRCAGAGAEWLGDERRPLDETQTLETSLVARGVSAIT